MKKIFVVAAMICTPMAALALPAIGDIVGTTPAEATVALAAKDCAVLEFEAEDGQIEAKCTNAAQQRFEVYINPKTGAVTGIKAEDE
jgi:hypothetical protein